MKTSIELTVGPYRMRTIGRDDIEAVRLLRNGARYAFRHTDEIGAEQQELWYERYLANDGDLLVVAERDGQIVGMAGLVDVGQQAVEFGRLAVAETERRRGLGFALTAKLVAWAFVQETTRAVELEVRRENEPARRLYEQLGFMETRQDHSFVRMEAAPSETDKWQRWDHPGVAEALVAYWTESHAERAHRAWLADVIGCAAPEGSVLEVGCGSGGVYQAIRDVRQVQSYEGIDSSRAMLAIAKVSAPQAHWRVGDLRRLPPGSATTVVCFDVLGHVPGDLVPELRSIIGAACDTAIVALWTSKDASNRVETVAGSAFLHNSRTHANVLRAIYEAAPDCRVVQHRGYGENIAYVIRTKQPFVHSVIVGSYNRPTYVRKAIRSVMEQSYPHWQLIVSDDGSNEETLDGIREEFGGDERCHLIVTTDRLPDGPRPSGNVRAVERINDAITLVRGDIVHYLPDDDWFLPGRFEAFNVAFRDPTVMMTYGEMKYADDDVISPTERIYPGVDVDDPWCRLDQTQVAHRAICFAKVPKWATTNIGYAADGVFYRDLCRAGYGPVRPFNVPVSVHRRHGFNMQKGQEKATEKREG